MKFLKKTIGTLVLASLLGCANKDDKGCVDYFQFFPETINRTIINHTFLCYQPRKVSHLNDYGDDGVLDEIIIHTGYGITLIINQETQDQLPESLRKFREVWPPKNLAYVDSQTLNQIASEINQQY